jgi:type I restriction enzyme S subunit
VNINNLRASHIEEIPIPVAPLSEQRRIVAEIEKQFTRLDAGVAALKRAQANLQRYRASVLKAACEGRLVPTEASLYKPQTPNSKLETGEALLQRILAERRKKWVGRGKYKEPATPDTSSLLKLPQDWTLATVEQLSNRVQYGHTASASKRTLGPRFLRITDIQDGGVDWSTVPSCNISADEVEDLRLLPGDIVFARTGATVGKSFLLSAPFPESVFASYLIRISPATSILSSWLYAFFQSPDYWAQIRDSSAGIGQPNVNGTKLQALRIPLPPLVEQKRIVAEVERRLSVVDELEATITANLTRATRLRQSILQKAFSGELVARRPVISESKVEVMLQPGVVKRPNSHFARALLSAEIVYHLHDEPTFGRVKHQKILHLCEHIAQIEEVKGQYHREAAGPLDNRMIYASEAELRKQKWYETVTRNSYGHAYKPLAKAGCHRKYMERYWPEKLSTIERLIKLMRTWSTDQCEIFCTAYAAWNDLILGQKQPTPEAILHEILECWHERKKRISEDRWRKAIVWMKDKGFIPTGFGRPTIRST